MIVQKRFKMKVIVHEAVLNDDYENVGKQGTFIILMHGYDD